MLRTINLVCFLCKWNNYHTFQCTVQCECSAEIKIAQFCKAIQRPVFVAVTITISPLFIYYFLWNRRHVQWLFCWSSAAGKACLCSTADMSKSWSASVRFFAHCTNWMNGTWTHLHLQMWVNNYAKVIAITLKSGTYFSSGLGKYPQVLDFWSNTET